jgi:hypothetical protein
MAKAKIAITLEPDAIARVKARVRARKAASVSAFIARAVDRELEEESMADLIQEMEKRGGKPTRRDRAWARKVLGK